MLLQLVDRPVGKLNFQRQRTVISVT